ncbi:MAG: DUF3572 domain-containing protein [Rhizobiales bacterium]|nr:DUF3572 domain-containing protein [Hyphomicrobiales bacterium]
MLKEVQGKNEDEGDLALKLLGFLASDPDLIGRFMALTGLSPNDLRQSLADPAFQAGVLDFALQDESLLLAFAANAGIRPESVMRARSRLPGFAH